MSLRTSAVDPEKRFAAQTLERQSQGLQSNPNPLQQHHLTSDHPFPARYHSPSNSMIGPTAPAAPYDPNVYPSYPPAERHQQDYEHFIMTQLSGPITDSSGIPVPPASAANAIGRPPQAVYNDNTIERMVQRDLYANPYPTTSTTNSQAFLGGSGGGYPIQSQNPYAAASGATYANGTTPYPHTQPQGGMYYDPNLLLSPDSIPSIESPPMMMHQGQTHGHTTHFYQSVNRTNSSEKEVPFSQIVARNTSNSPQNSRASTSPTNPNYALSGQFPGARSAAAANNGAMMGQQIQAVRATIKSKSINKSGTDLILCRMPLRDNSMASYNLQACSRASLTHTPTDAPPLRPPQRDLPWTRHKHLQSMRIVLKTGGCKLTDWYRNISGRRMAAAVSRRDPQQRLTNPKIGTSKQMSPPGPSADAGKRSSANATAMSQGGGPGKRPKMSMDSDSSSSGGMHGMSQPSRL